MLTPSSSLPPPLLPPFHPVVALGEQVHPGNGRCAVLASDHHHIGRGKVRCASGRHELCEAFFFLTRGHIIHDALVGAVPQVALTRIGELQRCLYDDSV